MPQTLTLEQAMGIAVAHHQAGRFEQARSLYQHILSQQPQHADAHHLLGLIALQAGQNESALKLIQQAVQLKPAEALFHVSLGDAYLRLGQSPQALAALERAIELRPIYPEAHFKLGILHDALNRLDESIAAYRSVIRSSPGNANAYINMGNALYRKGLFREAVDAHRTGLQLNPKCAAGYSNLSAALCELGQYDAALDAAMEAVKIDPNSSHFFNNLGNSFCKLTRMEAAVTAYTRATQLDPKSDRAYNNLGNAYSRLGRLDMAVDALSKALEINPASADACMNLGNALKDQGNIEQALALYRRSADLNPESHVALSSYCYVQTFHPAWDAAAQLRSLREWDNRHGRSAWPVHRNDPSPDRRLRIGYVSPNWGSHVIGRNLWPLIREHDRGQFEISIYSDLPVGDALTEQFMARSDVWRNIVGFTHADVAGLIMQDRIDILVDLTLHLSENRLPVFAKKPAPVQVTFAGYPGGTGLQAIDYRLTDPYLDPSGVSDGDYVEQSIRLPDTFWCFDPSADTPFPALELTVAPLPAQRNGFITFGCLNNYCKISNVSLSLWAKVMVRVPNSRLVLLCPDGAHRQSVTEHLRSCGIDARRIEFVTHKPRQEYLKYYDRIDIGLDTLPYNGHSTSLDSYWMGVPVVTLVGKTVVGRAGLSQLTNLGLTELIAHSSEQYVEIATALAGDLARLSEMRQTLRERMKASPLMDAPRFARGIEAAYRQMWRRWCNAAG